MRTSLKNMEFEKELESLINRCCLENASDTPDFILMEYLVHCLNAFNTGITARDKWYGVKHWAGKGEVASN